MKKILPIALVAVLLAGCGATNGLTAANRATGTSAAQSKAGAEKGVRGMYRYAFTEADADKNGYLTLEEMPAFAAGQPGDPLPAKKAMMERFDLNKNGRVTFNEFASKENVATVTAQFRRAVGVMFANMDTDGNRLLVADEMAEAVLSFESADKNKNGKVTLSELEDAMAVVIANGGGFGKPVAPVEPPAPPVDPVAPPAEEPGTF